MKLHIEATENVCYGNIELSPRKTTQIRQKPAVSLLAARRGRGKRKGIIFFLLLSITASIAFAERYKHLVDTDVVWTVRQPAFRAKAVRILVDRRVKQSLAVR